MSKKPRKTHPERRTPSDLASDGGLAAARHAKGLAVYALAVQAGLSPAALLRMERGESVIADNIVAVARALGVTSAHAFSLWLSAAAKRLDDAARLNGTRAR